MASSSKPNIARVDEDVDDLDDVLEQFTAPSKSAAPAESSKQSVPPSSSRGAPGPPTGNAFTDAFAMEFARGMETLLKELEDGDVKLEELGKLSAEEKEKEKEQERLFKEAWGKIMSDAEPPASASASPTPANTKSSQKTEGSFQERIRQTMDKMNEGQSSLKSSGGGGDPAMEDLLSSLNHLGIDGKDEEGLQGFLETMMSQLMSKEVLYEPLKEMHEKFPGYLAENENKLSAEDKERYHEQQKIVSQIIVIFEEKNYSEENPQTGVKVMSLMNEMQEYGAPPTEIMGELPPGVPVGPDGLPQLPGECCVM